MPSHKALKSVAHNFGHSFVSYSNKAGEGYYHFISVLIVQMQKPKANRLEIDVLKNESSPEQLLTNLIQKTINTYNHSFTEWVLKSGSSIDFVRSATMIVEFDLSKTRLNPNGHPFTDYPYYCEVIIIDDRGKEYKKRQLGWHTHEPRSFIPFSDQKDGKRFQDRLWKKIERLGKFFERLVWNTLNSNHRIR